MFNGYLSVRTMLFAGSCLFVAANQRVAKLREQIGSVCLSLNPNRLLDFRFASSWFGIMTD